MFHLFTHAFFKALLFLGAGSVIHAMHHEQDMRYYGALRREIPWTFWAMIMGTLAITGVGIMGVFGFAGFYSKDMILESAFASGTTHGGIAFFIGATAALLTSFYSWRLIFLTFYGKPRWAGSDHIQHAVHHVHEDAGEVVTDHDSATDHGVKPVEGTAGYHPHESPWSILVPLILLSLGSIFAGFLFEHDFVSAEAAHFWNGSIAFSEHLAHAAHEVPLWVKLTPLAVMLIGLAIAYNAYIRSTDIPGKFVAMFPGLHKFLAHKWYFDELYDAIFVRPAMRIGAFFWHRGDEQTIDRFGPHGAAVAVGLGNRVTARVQSGYLYSYALVMLLGLVAATSWVLSQ
jgi:NADH-quinone oxidoreductase subunit L